MKMKYRTLLMISVMCISFMIICLNTSNIEKSKLDYFVIKTSDFSQELEYNDFNPLESIEYEYDGVETFFFDTHLEKPLEWLETSDGSCSIYMETPIGNHRNVLALIDGSSGGLAKGYKWLEKSLEIDRLDTNTIIMSFWIRSQTNTQQVRYQGFDNNSEYFEGITLSHAGNLYYDNLITGTGNILQGVSGNTWYHILIMHSIDNVDTFPVYLTRVYVNQALRYNTGVYQYNFNYNYTYISFFTDITSVSYAGYIDSINYMKIGNPYSTNDYKTQVQNIDSAGQFHQDFWFNYLPLDNTKLFSMYNSILDILPTFENNYRTWFITDNVINTQYLNPYRILRLTDTESLHKKYKIIQLYFDDLNETSSFMNGLNQTIEIRIDTFNSTDDLVNKFYFNLEFNQSQGLITWNALYRKQTIPFWNVSPTNPIFDFKDYLTENLTTLQINFHMFLVYTNSTQKYLIIRTEVIFNDNLGYYYTYDKIINAGNNGVYISQDKIMVRYLDYFNENNGTDYLNNRFYTYNNLRGIRTLQLNSTDWKFNFLESGLFTSDLDFPVPIVPIDDSDGDSNPPILPKGNYWIFQTFKIQKKRTFITEFSESVPFFNDTIEVEFEFESDEIEGVSTDAYYPYDTELVKKKGLVDLSFYLFGVKIEVLNYLRDLGINVVNFGLLILQAFHYFLLWSINWIFLYIPMVFIIPFFWNIVVYGLLNSAYSFGFYMYVAIVILLGLLWSFWNYIWFDILVPLWFFMFEVFLPTLIIFWITVVIFLITCFIWFLTFGQGDFEVIRENVDTMVWTFIEYLFDTMEAFINDMPYFIIFLIDYLILVGFTFIMYLVCKGKGYYNRMLELESALKLYLFPFIIIYKLIIYIKDLLSAPI